MKVRLSCKFCGAAEDRELGPGDDVRAIGAGWIQDHKACASGKPIRVDVTGHHGEQDQEPEQLGSFRIDPEHDQERHG